MGAEPPLAALARAATEEASCRDCSALVVRTGRPPPRASRTRRMQVMPLARLRPSLNARISSPDSGTRLTTMEPASDMCAASCLAPLAPLGRSSRFASTLRHEFQCGSSFGADMRCAAPTMREHCGRFSRSPFLTSQDEKPPRAARHRSASTTTFPTFPRERAPDAVRWARSGSHGGRGGRGRRLAAVGHGDHVPGMGRRESRGDPDERGRYVATPPQARYGCDA